MRTPVGLITPRLAFKIVPGFGYGRGITTARGYGRVFSKRIGVMDVCLESLCKIWVVDDESYH